MNISLTKGLGVAILIGVLPLPYLYYIFLRWGVFIGLVYFLYKRWSFLSDKKKIIFCVIAILFNPLSPFFMPKMFWIVVDLIVGIYLYKYESLEESV